MGWSRSRCLVCHSYIVVRNQSHKYTICILMRWRVRRLPLAQSPIACISYFVLISISRAALGWHNRCAPFGADAVCMPSQLRLGPDSHCDSHNNNDNTNYASSPIGRGEGQFQTCTRCCDLNMNAVLLCTLAAYACVEQVGSRPSRDVAT